MQIQTHERCPRYGAELSGYDGSCVNCRRGAPLAVLALLAAIPANRLAAEALADLLSRRGLERPCEVLVAWAREA